MLKRKIREKQERREGAGHMHEKAAQGQLYTFASDQADTQCAFPGSQQQYIHWLRYQMESKFVDGVDGEVFSRTETRKKFQDPEPEINDADANPE